MKQGRAGRDEIFRKREPISHKVHESAVADLGSAVQYKKEPLYAGQGLKHPGPSPSRAGPGGGRTIHHSGSQGKHK